MPSNSSHHDSRLTRAAKLLVPPAAKRGIAHGIRHVGTASAALRPMPDFLIIGTKRGGTTTLWQTLLDHPQVMPMVPQAQHLKSSDYFATPRYGQESWYRGHFATALSRARYTPGKRVITGEASPHYLFDPRVAQRVATTIPDVKLLVALRDPVMRAQSHHLERVKAGVESLPFELALDAEPNRVRGELERMLSEPRYHSRLRDWYSYRTRGEYASQLVTWQELFPDGQIHVLFSEDLFSEPAETMNKVYRFLEIDEVELPLRHENKSRRAHPMPLSVKEELRRHYHPHNARLAELLQVQPPWPT